MLRTGVCLRGWINIINQWDEYDNEITDISESLFHKLKTEILTEEQHSTIWSCDSRYSGRMNFVAYQTDKLPEIETYIKLLLKIGNLSYYSQAVLQLEDYNLSQVDLCGFIINTQDKHRWVCSLSKGKLKWS